LHHHIRLNADGTSTAPAELPNAERKRRITETWQTHLERFPSQAKCPVIAHRLIFSMSKEQHDALVAVGINPDHVLHSSLKKVMRKFAEKFHPGDSIGFAYGLHHDTAHLHAHLALCPRTAKGRYLGCSTSRFSRSKHKKQMDLIKSWFERENQRWEKILQSPEETEHAVCQRIDSDKIVFAPRLNAAHLEALRNAQTAEAIRLQQSYRSISNLEAAIATKRQVLTAKRNVNFVSRLMHRRKPKLTRTVEKLAAAVDRRSLREMQSLLFKIKRNYRAAHERYSQTHGFNAYATRSTHHTTPIGSTAINSEFVICQNFVFRPANGDGFSHQTYEDGSAVTTVNFKSYTQGVPDPERRLFDFLISKFKGNPPMKSLDALI
jgi:hypothetical protein